MRILPARAKLLVPLIAAFLLLTQSGAYALGSGCIGCQIAPATIVAPRDHVPARSLLLWSSGELRPPAPPQAVSRPPASPRVGSARTGSSNPYVNPWGCEAQNAQEWDPSGMYWGKYQFDRQTWAAHGGNPSEYGSASEAEQDAVASRVKYDAWPNC